jgi:hypothetical protein
MFFTATGFILLMIGQIFSTILGIQLAGDLTLGGLYIGMLVAGVLIALIKEVAGVSSLSMASSGINEISSRSNTKKRAKTSEARHQQHRKEHNSDKKAHADYTRKLWKK